MWYSLTFRTKQDWSSLRNVPLSTVDGSGPSLRKISEYLNTSNLTFRDIQLNLTAYSRFYFFINKQNKASRDPKLNTCLKKKNVSNFSHVRKRFLDFLITYNYFIRCYSNSDRLKKIIFIHIVTWLRKQP